MDKMMSLMMDRMMDKLSKDDIQAMMAEMMGHLFAGMDLADRTAFMQSMMGVCLPRLTEGLGAAEREWLATTILQRMGQEIAGVGAASTATDAPSAVQG